MKLITLLLVVVLAATSYRDPSVTIPETVEVRAGDTASIEVSLEHVQTTMWKTKVYVDTDQIETMFLEKMEISADEENPVYLKEEISAGTKVSAFIDIKVAENSPTGQVRIPIIASGSKGPCMKGCEPFLVQKSCLLTIVRQDPKLTILLPETRFQVQQGEVITAEIQLKNYGAVTAYVEKLEAVPDKTLTMSLPDAPRQVGPGVTESVNLMIFTKDAAPGDYLINVRLVYKDQISNKFTDSKTLYITILKEQEPTVEPTPSPTSSPPPNTSEAPVKSEEKYSYFLAGMFTGAALFSVSIVIGLFLRKYRPTK